MRTSYSALNTYKTCPLKFKYQEIDRIKVPKGKEAVFGTTIHSALHYMFTHEPLYPSLDQVIDFFRQKWMEAQEKVTLEAKEAEAYHNQGATLLSSFYKKNQPWNFHVLDMESRFEVFLEDPDTKESHVVAGVIDRIDKIGDNHYEIIDYKTSRRMPAQAQLDTDLQMSVYHLGLLHKWPHLEAENIKLSLHFLKHGEKISTARSNDALKETRTQVLSTLREIKRRIAKDDFPPTPSALCDWCGYRSLCPMWRHLYQDEKSKIKNEQELAPLVQEYIALKASSQQNTLRLRELQAKIEDFMTSEKLERVFSDNAYLTRRNREKPVYDMERVRSILTAAGKWDAILKADERKLEAIVKTLPSETQEQLREAITDIKRFTILTLSKKKVTRGLDGAEEDTRS